jgi:hypothetical protein
MGARKPSWLSGFGSVQTLREAGAQVVQTNSAAESSSSSPLGQLGTDTLREFEVGGFLWILSCLPPVITSAPLCSVASLVSLVTGQRSFLAV